MVVLNVDQGSDAWLRARLGIPTASNFKRILTATGRLSTSSAQYMDELLAEWRTGAARRVEPSQWMQRGIEMEPEARACYASLTDASVTQVGLVYGDARKLIAASPDGMVGAQGLLEIKCPMPATHTAYLRAGELPPAYIPQVQGQLWVTKRKWCDFFSYHPGFAEHEQLLVRVVRDEHYIEKLGAAVERFVFTLLQRRQA